MKFKIEVLEKFSATAEEATDELQIKQGRMLEYLALSFPGAVSRKKLGVDLWPETELSTVNNRLRVALSGLRKQIGTALVETDAGIYLSRDSFSIDWFEIHEVLSQPDHVSDQDELDSLVEILPQLSKTLLPEIDEEWIDPFRQSWVREAIRGCARIGTLATQLNQLEKAVTACEVGLAHDLFDESLWMLCLRAKNALGQKDEVLRDFRAARQQLSAQMGLEFGSELLGLAREIREAETEGESTRTTFNPKELEFLGRVMERTLETNPAEFAKILASPSVQTELLRQPSITSLAFEKLFQADFPKDSVWLDSLSRVLVAKGQLHDWIEVNRVATEILEISFEDPSRRALVYFHRGFSRFQIRDWDGAFSDIDEAIRLTEAAGETAKVHNSRSLRASVVLHLGRHEEAVASYLEQEEYFKDSFDSIANHNKVIRSANLALAMIFMNDLPKALEYSQRAIQLAKETNQDSIIPMLYPQTGFVYMRTGELLQGAEMFIRGLKAGYERSDPRAMQIGLEYAAACLSKEGYSDFANRLFEYVNIWRQQDHHLRSPSEEAFVAQFITSTSGAGQLENLSRKEVILATFRMLRKSLIPKV